MLRWTCPLSLGLIVAAASTPSNRSKFDPCSYAAEDVLVRDVIVIGGGASGTYGAIQLKDAGRSVAVVEKAGRFGGHVNTVSKRNKLRPKSSPHSRPRADRLVSLCTV